MGLSSRSLSPACPQSAFNHRSFAAVHFISLVMSSFSLSWIQWAAWTDDMNSAIGTPYTLHQALTSLMPCPCDLLNPNGSHKEALLADGNVSWRAYFSVRKHRCNFVLLNFSRKLHAAVPQSKLSEQHTLNRRCTSY